MVRSLVESTARNVACLIRLPDAYSFAKRNLMKSESVIIMYHRISPRQEEWALPRIRPETFEAHVRHFCRDYEIVSLEMLLESSREKASVHRKMLAITSDDGYKDNYTYMFPILRKYSLPATIFLATGHINSDKLLWWDEVGYAILQTTTSRVKLDRVGTYSLPSHSDRLRVVSAITRKLHRLPDEGRRRAIGELIDICGVDTRDELARELMLSWEEIAEMSEAGVDFGAHTVSHPVLTNMPPEEAESEIKQSKDDVERRTGVRADFFAYPHGAYSAPVAKIVERIGFRGAVTCDPNWIGKDSDPHQLGRIEAAEDYAELMLMLCGFSGDMQNMRSRFGSAARTLRKAVRRVEPAEERVEAY